MTEKIVQLVDKDDNNIYPVAGSLKSGSVTTNAINDEAVTGGKIADNTIQPHNIDFSAFDKLQTYVTTTVTADFTAPCDGTLLLIGVGTSVWGNGGGPVRVSFVKKSGSATPLDLPSVIVNGGDQVGRTVVVSARVSFETGQDIRLAIEGIDGAALQNLGNGFCMGLFIPEV